MTKDHTTYKIASTLNDIRNELHTLNQTLIAIHLKRG